ncbi:glycosyltransferase [Shewanella sp.]|uniref:glycosyltransferase n=1 Tax=Shewanella sp. TaxID=50422 RepID=UPI003A985747
MDYFSDKITFVIFTYNEEKRIERVIKNLCQFGQVLIADNKSTDRTVEIAEKYGCKIYVRPESCTYVESQQMMDALASVIDTPWLYWGFADEMLDLATLIKINEVIESGEYDAISIDRKNYFWGQFCYDAYSARTNKIFKVGALDFSDNKIHGFGKLSSPDLKIFQLPDIYFVHHFISNTIESYLNTINRYTNVEAGYNVKSRNRILSILRSFTEGYVRQYFINRGYRAGTAGLALVSIQIMYSIVKTLKTDERKLELTSVEIEKCNDVHRDRIISNLSFEDKKKA